MTQVGYNTSNGSETFLKTVTTATDTHKIYSYTKNLEPKLITIQHIFFLHVHIFRVGKSHLEETSVSNDSMWWRSVWG